MKASVLVVRVARFYQNTAVIVFNTLLLFGVLEFAAFVTYQTVDVRDSGNQLARDPRETVSYYKSQDWAEQYWTEHRRSDVERYHPYVVWRRSPFHGSTIEIDSRGFRVTPGARCAAGSYTVFAFGGSTMWGTGSPQWGTIPAYLQSGLATTMRRPVCVVNLGESGWVSSQEVVLLISLMENGYRPDLELFYDGVNDIYAAYQTGEAVSHMNLTAVEQRFNKSTQTSLLGQWIRSRYLFRVAGHLATSMRRESEADGNLDTYQTRGLEAPAVSAAVARAYLANYTIVEALSCSYGFNSVFFWQPSAGAGSKLFTAEEKVIVRRIAPAHATLSESVTMAVEDAASHGRYPNLHSLVGVFDAVPSSVWIDGAHVTPAGNRMIADRILSIIADPGTLSAGKCRVH